MHCVSTIVDPCGQPGSCEQRCSRRKQVAVVVAWFWYSCGRLVGVVGVGGICCKAFLTTHVAHRHPQAGFEALSVAAVSEIHSSDGGDPEVVASCPSLSKGGDLRREFSHGTRRCRVALGAQFAPQLVFLCFQLSHGKLHAQCTSDPQAHPKPQTHPNPQTQPNPQPPISLALIRQSTGANM